jgi:hypothetical protein
VRPESAGTAKSRAIPPWDLEHLRIDIGGQIVVVKKVGPTEGAIGEQGCHHGGTRRRDVPIGGLAADLGDLPATLLGDGDV